MSELRKSTKENPLTQEELLKWYENNKDQTFEVEKVPLDVTLQKLAKDTLVKTTTLARNGRKIEETENNAKAGQAVDTRYCINGDLDQYAKKPEKVAGSYDIEGGRSWEDIAPDETVNARTIGGERRPAFVVKETLFIKTEWGSVQEVGTGGLVTIAGKEFIGNNGNQDLVIRQGDKKGKVTLNSRIFEVRADAEKQGIELTPAIEEFFKIAAAEDNKNPYLKAKANDMMKVAANAKDPRNL